MKNLSKAAIYALAASFTRLDNGSQRGWDYLWVAAIAAVLIIASRQSAWWLFWGKA